MADPAQQYGSDGPTPVVPPPPPPPPPPAGWPHAGTLSYQAPGACDPAVLEEIVRIQQKKSSWGSTLAILVISLLAFVIMGMMRGRWDGQFLAILVGALFFHEAGHYLAMRLSGYQNLRMFFIPFLGAAVSGQCYNVPGWKKVVVSLMGPVPGIIIAIPLGIVGVLVTSKILTSIAMLLLILNGLNLLPLLPLDGGHIVHNLLFSRNMYLDMIFRCIAAGLVALIAVASGDPWIWPLAIITAIQIPAAYKLATVVAGLRREGFVPLSHDNKTIPPEIAGPIADRIRRAFPAGLSSRLCAQHTISVFESLNARPPSWPVTIAFLFGHGMALMAALGMVAVIPAVASGRLALPGRTSQNRDMLARFEEISRHKHGVADDDPLPPVVTAPRPRPIPALTVVASFPKVKDAEKAALEVQPLAPAGVGVIQVGDSLLIPLPGEESGVRDRLFDALSKQTRDVFVANPEEGCLLSLSGDAANAKELGEVLALVLRFPGADRLRTPWDPTDPRTPQEKARGLATLKVAQEVLYATSEVYKDKPWQDLNQQITDAFTRADRPRIKELQAQDHALRKAAFLAQLDKLAAEHPQHQAMIAAGRDLADELQSREFDRTAAEKLGPFVGQLPADQPNPFGVRSGYASGDKKLLLNTTLISPADSLPALLRWLREQGVTNLRYDLFQGRTSREDDRDED